MIFDTHTHLNDRCFSEDREEILADFPAKGVDAFTEIGYDLPSSREAVRLAEALDNAGFSSSGASAKEKNSGSITAYAAIGLHPDAAATVSEEVLASLRELAGKSKKVVAVGEIGLDYHYTDAASPEEQKRCFTAMLRLARELSLPIVIHSREAAKDTYDLVIEEKGYENGGIVHCFSYSPEVAEQYTKLGMYIGIGGVLTFPNGKKLKQVAERIPLSRIVLETDCPYMAPVPLRGTRNDPRNLVHVVDTLAEIKGVSPEEVIRVTSENARKVYRL